MAGVFDPPIFFRGGKADETGHGHALIVLGMPYEIVLQKELPYSRTLAVACDDERTAVVVVLEAVIERGRSLPDIDTK